VYRRSKLFVNPLNMRVSGRVRYEANRNSVKGTVRCARSRADSSRFLDDAAVSDGVDRAALTTLRPRAAV
jgi:hypothetical protein